MSSEDSLRFDFLGVVALFGGDIAVKAWRFCTLERRYALFALHLVPGQMEVAKELLKRCDHPVARFLAPGETKAPTALIGLDAPSGLKYIGLRSGTMTDVQNPLASVFPVVKYVGEQVEVRTETVPPKGRRPTDVKIVRISDGPSHASPEEGKEKRDPTSMDILVVSGDATQKDSSPSKTLSVDGVLTLTVSPSLSDPNDDSASAQIILDATTSDSTLNSPLSSQSRPSDHKEPPIPVRLRPTKQPWILLLSTIASLVGTAYTGVKQDWPALAVCLSGMLTNFLFHIAAHVNGTNHPEAKPAKESPPGHALIYGPGYATSTRDTFVLLLGSERGVQRTLQNSFSIPDKSPYSLLNIIAGLVGISATLATFILIPQSDFYSQLAITGMLVMGLFTNGWLAARTGKSLLVEIAENDYGAHRLIEHTFGSRCAALAYAVFIGGLKDYHLLSTVLPNSAIWITWKRLLVKICEMGLTKSGNANKAIAMLNGAAAEVWKDAIKDVPEEQRKLWKQIVNDMGEALRSAVADYRVMPEDKEFTEGKHEQHSETEH